MSFRKVSRLVSKITATWSASISSISFISMVVKPNTALVGVPSDLFIGGRAWNARKI